MKEIVYKEVSYKLVGIAMEVHNRLGYGFLEKVYENAYYILIRKNGLKVEQQKPIKVVFEGEVIGEYIADLVIDDKIIIEVKACNGLISKHKSQLINYLKATGMELGILINFGTEKLEYQRVLNR